MKSELEKLYNLADEIEIAMMTTRRRDGHLRSRAMASQKREPDLGRMHELVEPRRPRS